MAEKSSSRYCLQVELLTPAYYLADTVLLNEHSTDKDMVGPLCLITGERADIHIN